MVPALPHKRMTSKDLVEVWGAERRSDGISEEKWKCNTMHIECTAVPKIPANTKPMAGFGPAMGAGE